MSRETMIYDPAGNIYYLPGHCPSCKSKDSRIKELEGNLRNEHKDYEDLNELYEMRDAQYDRLREVVADIPEIIRGHKSHWQETIDKVQRDELLETVAKHVEHLAGMEEG
jgi:hypothetical protein